MHAPPRFALNVAQTSHMAKVLPNVADVANVATNAPPSGHTGLGLRCTVEVDGTVFEVMTVGQGQYLVRRPGECGQTLVTLDPSPQPTQASVNGQTLAIEVTNAHDLALARALSSGPAGSNDGAVRTPMPGRIVRVLVVAGQNVALGEPVVIVEAMKMENEVRAARAGIVANVVVRDGDAVESGALLLEIATVA